MKREGALVLALVIGGCGGSGSGATAPVAGPPTAAVTATPPAATRTPAPPDPDSPPTPGAVLVDTVPARSMAGTNWIGSQAGAVVLERGTEIVVLDPGTGLVEATIPLPDLPQINAFLLTADSLWVTDHDGGRVIRLDRKSAALLAEIELPSGRAVSLLETEDGIWAGHAHAIPEGVSLIDPATNTIVRRIDEGAFPAAGLGSLWFGKGPEGDVAPNIRRVDPSTGEVVGSIEEIRGCYINGRFPDAAWSFCLLQNVDTIAVRLDVESLQAGPEVPLGGGGGLIGVVGDRSWFDAWAPDDSFRLLAIDNASNTIVEERSFARNTRIAIVGDDLWIVDKFGLLWRLPLGDTV